MKSRKSILTLEVLSLAISQWNNVNTFLFHYLKRPKRPLPNIYEDIHLWLPSWLKGYEHFPALQTVYQSRTEKEKALLTCMPNILHPNIGTGSKKQPLYWYKQIAHYIRCYGDANKKHWKCLKWKDLLISKVNVITVKKEETVICLKIVHANNNNAYGMTTPQLFFIQTNDNCTKTSHISRKQYIGLQKETNCKYFKS